MKPCKENRRDIVWIAMDNLDAAQAPELTAHLQYCQACRDYLHEISRVKKILLADAGAPKLESNASLHGRILLALHTKSLEHPSTTALLGLRAPDLIRKFLIPAISILLLSAVIVAMLEKRPESRPPALTQTNSSRPKPDRRALLPTLANYHAVANESLEEFDDLLTLQARKPVPTPTPFSATTLALLNPAD